MASSRTPRNIVIIGNGVIGACSAYYLTRHPLFDPRRDSITVLEATKTASGSSGKAGGMLASWASPDCLAPLSFRLHQELADEHDGTNWGYRRIHCAEFAAVGRAGLQAQQASLPPASIRKDLDWVDWDNIKSYHEVGNPDDSAQVHPYLFTTTMSRLAQDKEAKVVIGTATSVNHKSNGQTVESVTYSKDGKDHVLECTDVLIAAGPWTPQIFPRAPIGGARSHSIVMTAPRPLSPWALWPDITPGPKGRPKESISPEIYTRPDGTAYSCGPTDYDVPLPPSSDQVAVNDQSCNDIAEAVGSISRELDGAKVVIRQACYRPIVVMDGKEQDAGPLLGETGIEGLFMATGHNVWGIQNSAGTGKVISEMIFDRKARSADVSSLDPRKLLKPTSKV